MKTNKFWMLVVAVCTMLVLALPLSAQNKGKESKSDTKQTQSAPATSAKLDLNTASLKDLEALPGVGAATARKIIAGRPYASIADLKKAGVPQRTIDKIQGQVTVSSGNAPRATQGAQSTSSKSSAASSEIPARSSQRPKGEPTVGTPSAVQPPSSSGSSSATETRKTGSNSRPQAAAAGGQVWVNLDTKVYHRQGDRWYGKTKHGQ